MIDFGDFWQAWKHNKSDFFVIVLTFSLEFIFNTEVSLATGLSATLLVYVVNSAFSSNTQLKTIATAANNNGVDILQFQGSDFTFMTHFKVKTEIVQLSYLAIKYAEKPGLSVTIFKNVTQVLDGALRPALLKPVDTLGRGVILDCGSLRVIDWTAMTALDEALFETKSRGVTTVVINVHDTNLPQLQKFGIKNYVFDTEYFAEFLKQSTLETKVLVPKDVEAQFELTDSPTQDVEQGFIDDEEAKVGEAKEKHS